MTECLDRFGGLVWSLARRLSANAAEAEDAVQEVFIDLWRSAHRFDAELSSETTFVAMIARRRLVDRHRRQRRTPATTQLADASGLTAVVGRDDVELGDEAAQAALALQTLRPDQQEVLRLSIYDGLSHDEIAQSTGLPLGTVKTHARRGLIRIRELLNSVRPKKGGTP